jgi:hypothetical protein
MGELDIDEGTALKYIFKKWGMRERRWILLSQNMVSWQAGCSEDCNEPLSSVRQETFLLTE